jgi:acyl-CoA synthetase (AMP-forming)/AMP-acid ligase II
MERAVEVDPGVQPPLVGTYTTLGDALAAAGRQHGERDAFVDGADRLSFAAWVQRADALAAALVARGVHPGDVVAIMLPASIDYAVAYGAIALAGAVATGLNSRLGEREIQSILDRAAPALAIVDRAAFAAGPAAGVAVIERNDLPALCAGRGIGAARPTRRATDPAVIIWTSGTTGLPKGAWFDHRNLEAAVASAGVMSRPYDVKLAGTPFAHAGFMAKLWDQLAWGTTSVLTPAPWRAADMLRVLVDERVTVAGGVPVQWSKLLDEPGIGSADLSRVRLGLVATAPASPELIGRVAATIGCPLVVRYAMTESPSITGTEPDDDPEVQCRTVGRPQAGMEIAVVDGQGRAVPSGEVGRVLVRGACVMRGYWQNDALTASVLDADGWLTSTDLGRVDVDGNLVLVGRSGDMYIRGGYNVHPLEVEHVIAEHPGVGAVAVVGSPAPVIGEIGVAFVVPADAGAPPTLGELRAWVAGRLADYKAPDRLVLVDALPLTAMMKVDKVELGERAARTADDRPRPVTTNDAGRRS